jgi:hypothetical protein
LRLFRLAKSTDSVDADMQPVNTGVIHEYLNDLLHITGSLLNGAATPPTVPPAHRRRHPTLAGRVLMELGKLDRYTHGAFASMTSRSAGGSALNSTARSPTTSCAARHKGQL